MAWTGGKILAHQLSSVLPDDRPITAINIIEDIDKCPPNFTVVSRTHDLDADADLWRESGLFIKKRSRYICFSKTEGLPHSVVEKISIIDDRDPPPSGFSMISHTVDTMQKAWRKRQLCYRIRNRELCTCAVSDIIICSKIGKGTKAAPDEFTFAGVLNGVYICYKTVNLTIPANAQTYANLETLLPSPYLNGSPHRPAPERPPKPKQNSNLYPQMNSPSNSITTNESDLEYEVLNPNSKKTPSRPAPMPPTDKSVPVFGTLSNSNDLNGVPFVLNPRLSMNKSTPQYSLPIIKPRTIMEIEREYSYDFLTERAT